MAEPNDKTTYTAEELRAEIAKATEGIRAELVARKAQNKETESQLEKLKEQLDNMAAEAERRAEELQNTELEEKGKYKEALDNVKKKHGEEIESINAALKEANSTIEKLLVDKEVLVSATEAVNPQQVLTLMKAEGRVKVKTDANGKHVVEVFDANGVELFDDDGKPATVKYAVEQYLLENPNLSKANVVSGAGSQHGVIPGKKSIDDLIAEAHERGDTVTVYKLKNRKQSAAGPHSLLTSNKKT